jgi:hypothetical protein
VFGWGGLGVISLVCFFVVFVSLFIVIQKCVFSVEENELNKLDFG